MHWQNLHPALKLCIIQSLQSQRRIGPFRATLPAIPHPCHTAFSFDLRSLTSRAALHTTIENKLRAHTLRKTHAALVHIDHSVVENVAQVAKAGGVTHTEKAEAIVQRANNEMLSVLRDNVDGDLTQATAEDVALAQRFCVEHGLEETLAGAWTGGVQSMETRRVDRKRVRKVSVGDVAAEKEVETIRRLEKGLVDDWWEEIKRRGTEPGTKSKPVGPDGGPDGHVFDPVADKGGLDKKNWLKVRKGAGLLKDENGAKLMVANGGLRKKALLKSANHAGGDDDEGW